MSISLAEENDLLWRGSGGDRAALLRLARSAVGCSYVSHIEAMTMAEVFARLAASDGSAEAGMMLAGILRVRACQAAELGDVDRALALIEQSDFLCDQHPRLTLSDGVEFLGGVLSAESDMGDELATIRLTKLCEALGASDADRLRTSINKACADHRKAPKPETVSAQL